MALQKYSVALLLSCDRVIIGLEWLEMAALLGCGVI